MIELLVFLFVLQGDSSSEWIDSCNTNFTDYIPPLSENNPDVHFCNVVISLNLSEKDVERLGKELDWLRYVMGTSQDFIDDWIFFQENAHKDTLLIWPSISTRDSLPPAMKVTISFNYTENGEIKYFEEPFSINPIYPIPLCNDAIKNYECNFDDIDKSPVYELNCPPNTVLEYDACVNIQDRYDSIYSGYLTLFIFLMIGVWPVLTILSYFIFKNYKKPICISLIIISILWPIAIFFNYLPVSFG